MALLDRLKQELDRAGKAAQDAFDDGKTRLEAFRAVLDSLQAHLESFIPPALERGVQLEPRAGQPASRVP